MGPAKPQSAGDEMARAERMKTEDTSRTVTTARAKAPSTLVLEWSDGTRAEVDLAETMKDRRFRSLRDPRVFGRAKVGQWGHSVEWPSGAELGAEALWLETLAATGRHDTREFLEWRLRNGL